MVDDAVNRVKTDVTRADRRVAVFAGAAGVFAVVDVKDRQTVQPDDAVELLHDAVEVVDDVVARVVDVARVEAHPQALVVGALCR